MQEREESILPVKLPTMSQKEEGEGKGVKEGRRAWEIERGGKDKKIV